MDAIFLTRTRKHLWLRNGVKHLDGHHELYWGVGFLIKRRFSFPIYGYVHMKGGQVEYRASIRDIVEFSPDHYEDSSIEPESWRLPENRGTWKSEFSDDRDRAFLVRDALVLKMRRHKCQERTGKVHTGPSTGPGAGRWRREWLKGSRRNEVRAQPARTRCRTFTRQTWRS